MGDELPNLRLRLSFGRRWMPRVMEENKAADPAKIGTFGPRAKMLDPDHGSNRIDALGLDIA